MNSLFDENSNYTKQAEKLDVDAYKVLKPLFEKAWNEMVPPWEIAKVFYGVVSEMDDRFCVATPEKRRGPIIEKALDQEIEAKIAEVFQALLRDGYATRFVAKVLIDSVHNQELLELERER